MTLQINTWQELWLLSNTLGSAKEETEDVIRRDKTMSSIFNSNNRYYLLYTALNSTWIISFTIILPCLYQPSKSTDHLSMANWGLEWNNSTNYLIYLYKRVLAGKVAYAVGGIWKQFQIFLCVISYFSKTSLRFPFLNFVVIKLHIWFTNFY